MLGNFSCTPELTIRPSVTQAKGLFDEGNDMFGEEDSPGVDIFNKADGAPKLVNIFYVYMYIIFAIFVSPLVPTFCLIVQVSAICGRDSYNRMVPFSVEE